LLQYLLTVFGTETGCYADGFPVEDLLGVASTELEDEPKNLQFFI